MTQLVTHERIHTTWAKARALQFVAHKPFKLGQDASQNRSNAFNRLMGILTTKYAIKKLINEIIPKFKDPKEQLFKVIETKRRNLILLEWDILNLQRMKLQNMKNLNINS